MDQYQALRQGQGCFHGVREPLFNAGADDQPVHHHLHGVLVGLLQLDVLRQFPQLPVDADPDEAFLAEPLQLLLVLALLAADHRGMDLDPGALRQVQDPVHDLVDALLADLDAADRAVGDPTRAYSSRR